MLSNEFSNISGHIKNHVPQCDVTVMVYLVIVKVYNDFSVKVYKGSSKVLLVTNIKKKLDDILLK